MRERERERYTIKSKKPKWKVPRDYQCNNCIQSMGSSLCKMNPDTGKPCKWWTLLKEMAERGELEREE
jgi:hypothetical protein